MSAPIGSLLVALVALAFLPACNAGRAFIASSSDYSDYRAVRVAENVDQRMAATWEYLKARPDGRYADRLRRYFKRAEPVFFKIRSGSIKGLQAYLRALPDGPHAEDAIRLLVVMRDERGREDIDTRDVRIKTGRLDVERKLRVEAAGLLHWWLTALLDKAAWRVPLPEIPAELLVRFRLSLPQPECDKMENEPGRHRCTKPMMRHFRVAGEGKLVERTLAFELEIVLDEKWHLAQANITGGGILLATEEARREKAIEDSAAARAAAASAFVAKLTAALFDREVACNGGTDAGGRTLLECEGLRFTLEPGKRGSDDLMWIERIDDDAGEPAAPAPAPEATDSGHDETYE